MHEQNGNLSALASFTLGAITWLTSTDVELILRLLVGVGSVITAIMAIRYYYYAIVEKKKMLAGLIAKSKANKHKIEVNSDGIDVLEKKEKK